MSIVSQEVLLKACRSVGSQAALARRIGVSRCRLNNWINRGDRIPYEYLLAIEAATEGHVTCAQLVSKENVPEINQKASALSIHEQLSRLENLLQNKFQIIETLFIQLTQGNNP